MTIAENEWYIEAPWGRICIVAWGDCRNPPVLVCHGVSDSAATFRPLIRLFPTSFYYIGVDLPGCGKSDPFPPGLLFNMYDLTYALEVVVRHFRWSNFVFLGHSMGASVGKLYDFCLPGKITKSIELDPIGGILEPEDFSKWYKTTYQAYFDDYDTYNSPKEVGPVYTRRQALDKMIKLRHFTEQAAQDTIERFTEPAGDGLVRFTFDKRYKVVPKPPFSSALLHRLCSHLHTQVLVVPTEESVELNMYSRMPFMLDEGAHPNRNVRVRGVSGHHNVHVTDPENVAGIVAKFLLGGLEGLDTKSKL